MNAPKFSIIICSIEAAKFARVSECYRNLMAGSTFEIIGIHDAKSLAEAYNRGIRQARGDILIFSHDDIAILDPQFAAKVVNRLDDFDVLGFAGACKLIGGRWFSAGQPFVRGVIAHARPKAPYLSLDIFGVTDWPVAGGMKAIDGLCMIAKREVVEAVGFDAESFDGFHLYDLDFSFAAHLAGYSIGVCCDIPIIHESGGRFDQEHRKFEQRFNTKYAEFLDDIADCDFPNGSSKFILGRGARFRDVNALKRAWQPELLKRATAAIYRAPGKD